MRDRTFGNAPGRAPLGHAGVDRYREQRMLGPAAKVVTKDVQWDEFEAAAPEVAARGRQRFDATHVALLGTLRKDGSPRISPIEPYLVVGRLMIGALKKSLKAHDLLRDARCTLMSSVSDVNGSEGEFKLDGRAEPVTDPELLHGYEAWWTAPNASEACVFSIDIESAAHITWDIEQGEMTITRWRPLAGIRISKEAY